MKYNIDVNVEDGEIAIRNSHGDLAIIPKDKRDWVKQKLSEGCHDCIDSLVETLPVASQYAQDGSVYPPNTKVKVSHNNQIKEYDISSPEYRDLYNSGKLMSYDKTTDTYSATPLKEVTITAEAPQWLKDKRRYEFEFTKDMFIDKNMPKFSRAMGVSANNMHPNNVKEYDNIINDKVAESILKRNLKVGTSANDRLKWYNSLSEKEREIVNNSYSADKFSPAVRAYMESQSNEAKKYGILETFRDADKLAQSVEGTPERFRIFPNAENNYENYVNPLMWIGDMAKGLGNVSKDIKEENYLKAAGSVASPLLGGALGGLGAKTTGQFIKNTFLPLGGLEENIVKGGKNLVGATKILNKIDNNSFYRQIGKEGYEDAIKTGVIRSKPIGEYAGKAPYFVEGKDFDKLNSTGAGAVGKKPEYIFEMPQLKNPEEMSAFRVNQQAGYAPYVAGSKEIPISQGKIYRLNNKNEYELVDVTKAGSKVLNKLDDAVNNINRIKFDDFKNDNEFFRVIVGDEAFDDIVQTQKIRTKQPSSVKNTPPNTINLDRRGSTAFPSFSKGSPSLSYANDNPNHYIIRTADESIKPSTSGRHGKGTTMFPTDKSGKHLTELDASKVQVYKHVGNGEYELVDVTKAGSKVLSKTDDIIKPAISIADDVSKQASKPAWQMEELPGLHLKSTMDKGAVSKIVEPKTGLVNVEQALGIIGKESGGADKVALIKQGLGETIPKKMDYNEFRKVVQDQLIPLEVKINPTGRSEYGLERIGYYDEPPMDRGALILSNKSKFGRGSNAHGNPDETLGHIHFLRDAETPDVLTVTQIQSDAFQGTHRIMPKTQQEALEKVSKLKEEGVEIKSMFGDGKESSNSVLANYEKHLQLDEASAKNFTQKQLLDKNHPERYLQELVDYAGKRGDINKVRVPTAETAAKVQGYTPVSTLNKSEEFIKFRTDIIDALEKYGDNSIQYKKANEIYEQAVKNSKHSISPEDQTILKKYAEQPKNIKKLFGVEPKVVTDSKGNTWYEFDIPDKAKKGKMEIKAFTTTGATIGTGAALSNQSKNKIEQ